MTLGAGRCLHTWASGDNFQWDHRCWEPHGHEGDHRCICGAKPGDDTDTRRSDDAKTAS